MVSNGTSKRVLKAGVWAPIPTFFDDNEQLDVDTFTAHVVRLAKVGMQPVVCGSMGEAFHLAFDERVTLFKAARKALDDAGLTESTIIAGTGANTTRETIELSKAAAAAGADAVIVITPGYFQFLMDKPATVKQFFHDVQEGSPIPVMIYNFPGASGGIDIDSDLIIDIARSGPNICGVKLTCGAVGKLTRITAATATKEFATKYPRKSPLAPDFLTLGGFADFLLPTVMGARSGGAIMGLGNVYPAALSKLFQLSQQLAQSSTAEDLQKALELQDFASAADNIFGRIGIAGTKSWLQKYYGHPNGRMRRPILEVDAKKFASVVEDPVIQQYFEVEQSLSK